MGLGWILVVCTYTAPHKFTSASKINSMVLCILSLAYLLYAMMSLRSDYNLGKFLYSAHTLYWSTIQVALTLDCCPRLRQFSTLALMHTSRWALYSYSPEVYIAIEVDLYHLMAAWLR